MPAFDSHSSIHFAPPAPGRPRHEPAAVLTLSGRGNAVAPTPAGLRDA